LRKQMYFSATPRLCVKIFACVSLFAQANVFLCVSAPLREKSACASLSLSLREQMYFFASLRL